MSEEKPNTVDPQSNAAGRDEVKDSAKEKNKKVISGNFCMVLPSSSKVSEGEFHTERDFSEGEDRREKQKKAGKIRKTVSRLVLAVVLGTIAIMAVMLSLFVDNDTLQVDFYQVTSEKAKESLRIIQLSDLHDKQFGAGNELLLERLTELEPDLILLTGDMVTMGKTQSFDNLDNLCRALAQIAPTYASPGNHEFGIQFHGGVKWSMGDLQETGVIVLSRNYEELEINSQKLLLGGFYRTEQGFSGDEELQNYLADFNERSADAIKVMLVHEPNVYANCMTEYEGIDFVFSGHAHGGQIRLPVMGAVYAPDQGFFPKYTGGMTRFGNTCLLVSRGLGNDTFIPRINNRPEILVLDIER